MTNIFQSLLLEIAGANITRHKAPHCHSIEIDSTSRQISAKYFQVPIAMLKARNEQLFEVGQSAQEQQARPDDLCADEVKVL